MRSFMSFAFKRLWLILYYYFLHYSRDRGLNVLLRADCCLGFIEIDLEAIKFLIPRGAPWRSHFWFSSNKHKTRTSTTRKTDVICPGSRIVNGIPTRQEFRTISCISTYIHFALKRPFAIDRPSFGREKVKITEIDLLWVRPHICDRRFSLSDTRMLMFPFNHLRPRWSLVESLSNRKEHTRRW